MFGADDDATGDADGMARRSPAGCDGSGRQVRGRYSDDVPHAQDRTSTRGDRACDSARRRPAGGNRPQSATGSSLRPGSSPQRGSRPRPGSSRARRRARPGSTRPPWTRKPRRAPTSTSSPAAAGWPATRSRPIVRGTAGSTSCRSATTRSCATSSKPRPPRRRIRTPKKIGDYYASCMDESAIAAKGAAPLKQDADRIAALAGPADLAPLVADSAPHGRQRVLPLRLDARFQGRLVGHRRRRSGRAGPAGSRLLLERRRRSQKLRTRVHRACRTHVAPGRGCSGRGRRRRRRRSCGSRRRWRRRARSRQPPRLRRTCTTRCRSTKSRR